MKKSELFLEEAVLDDLAQGLDSLELPLNPRVFQLIGGAVFLIALTVCLRILSLGWWERDFWRERALINASQITTLRAERGVILDREGKPLTKNIPTFRLNIKIADLLKNLKQGEQELNTLESILDMPPNYIKDLVQEVNLEKQNSLTIARRLDVNQVIKIKNLNLPGIQIENDFERQYSNAETFSHFIGFVGPASKSDLVNKPFLNFNDVLGKTGIEAYYDKELRGEDGEVVSYRNAKGELVGEKLRKNPIAGYELYSTIDSGLQSYFYGRLKEGLNFVGSRSGVGIALNPQNGEVLALVSLPSFDNNKISPEELANPHKPFFNRAVSGAYPPGSTIKPLVALAALKEGVVSPEEEIFSRGYIEVPNPYNPDQPSRFVDWKPHGWVNLYSAIARSSNVYFYALGGGLPKNEYGIFKGTGEIKGLGIERLKDYWQRFGLGEKTGIDLPGENKGFLPDPDTKEKNTGEIWRIGDTYNVTIGQGDILVTPIELINYIAAIGNGGKIYRPFIVKKIISEDGATVKEVNPQLIKDYSGDVASYIKEVERGMIDAVSKPYGTSYLLSDLPVSVATKTGTAQVENKAKLDAIFVGYAPSDNPQIAILVLIENAREGSLNAVPVAKDVLGWYYWNRIKS